MEGSIRTCRVTSCSRAVIVLTLHFLIASASASTCAYKERQLSDHRGPPHSKPCLVVVSRRLAGRKALGEHIWAAKGPFRHESLQEGRSMLESSPAAETDAQVLLSWKRSLQSSNTLDDWEATGGTVLACGWKGVSCDTKSGRVTALSLSEMSLSGPIPPSLGNLSALVELDLSSNELWGPIPPSLGSLMQLQVLSLASNSALNGTIPSSFASLTSLTHLSLAGNTLSGGIPPSLGQLKKLQALLLGSNTLTGPLPPEIGHLAALTELDLSNNQLTGEIPASLGNLPRLQSLILDDNVFSGSVPSFVGNLKSLTLLSLTNNNFSGSLPGSLGQLEKLDTLQLGVNFLTGPLPPLLPSRLRHLDLSDNLLSGPIPPSMVGALPRLEYLDLSTNTLNGSIPSDVGNLTGLTYLALSGNSLLGAIPPSLGQLSELHFLALNQNNLTGPIPPELSSLRQVAVLDLSVNLLNGSLPAGFVGAAAGSLSSFNMAYNRLTGQLPAALGECAGLVTLDVSSNRLTGPIPAALGQLQGLVYLYLSNNSFTGGIPPELGNCSMLSAMDVSFNRLTGAVPDVFDCRFGANLPPGATYFGLNVFLAAHNRLVGSLPAGLAKCGPYLQQLDLSNNELSSVVSSLVDSLTALLSLSLNDNQFSGPIPSLGNASLLQQLDLSNNTLTGELPAYLRRLTSLQSLNLGQNQLTGPLPSSFSGLANVSLFNASHNRLTGGIPASIARLSASLAHLYLNSNNLSGALPPALADLPFLQDLDLSNNAFSGGLSPLLVDSHALTTLLAANNSLSGPLPAQLVSHATLRDLDLSGNRLNGTLAALNWSGAGKLESVLLQRNALSGAIPASLSGVGSLKVLSLAHNALVGAIPHELTVLALASLDLSFNNLSGGIPPGRLADFPPSAYAGNPLLCAPPLERSCSANDAPGGSGGSGGGAGGSGGHSNSSHLSAGAVAGIVVGIVAAAVLVVAAVVVALFGRGLLRGGAGAGGRKKVWQKDYSRGTLIMYETLPVAFTMEDLYLATDGFHDAFLLGRGGFGSVYRALLPDGKTEVAVKVLAEGSNQGEQEFRAEMDTLGRIRHSNLVTLLGVYVDAEADRRMLIYNYLQGGSLQACFGEKGKEDPRLAMWSHRLEIALGTARGLKYLHHDLRPHSIIHRDIKPANVLLDEALTAYVADFGLAKSWDASEATHMSTAVRGTMGYMAPEYALRARLTEKTDVYAFGIILLQLVTGLKPTNPDVAEQGMPLWSSLQEPATIVDPALEVGGEEGLKEVFGMLKLGQACAYREPGKRPTMAEALHVLENLKDFASGIAPSDKEGAEMTRTVPFEDDEVESVSSGSFDEGMDGPEFSHSRELENCTVIEGP